MLNGIINIYKEKGFTSHDVVAKARGILRERRIGHTGTLDPEAEGVLPLCIGAATKAVPYLSDADKCYQAEVILGVTTTTEDATGEILTREEVKVSRDEVEQVVKSFVGTYTQTPPMYSAIKVNGVRLYELARKGLEIERPSREVMIYDCHIMEWLNDNRFKIEVSCSKGTYIRTLCTDIGRKLACGAHMGALLRTKVGDYTLKESLTLQQLEENKEDVALFLKNLETLFSSYPKAQINRSGKKLLQNGNALKEKDIQLITGQMKTDLVRVYNEQNEFVALYKWDASKEHFRVEKMFQKTS